MTPEIPTKKPCRVELEEGKNYFWCSCGKSSRQPFCDGSHKGTEFSPVRFTAEKTGPAVLCACKHSKTGHLCDGSHKQL